MFLIGIAGGSGSGKTTFAQKVICGVSQSEKAGIALLHQDSYYQAEPPRHLTVHGEKNFDHPNAFDWKLICAHLEGLKAGHQIDVPVYDFKTSRRTQESVPVGPCQAIIMEGIFTLWDPKIRSLFDIKIYLDVDADIRFIRRLHRDVHERGRSLDGIIRQYYDSVRPMHHEYLEPTRQYADIVVGEETDIAADVLAARIEKIIRRQMDPDFSPNFPTDSNMEDPFN